MSPGPRFTVPRPRILAVIALMASVSGGKAQNVNGRWQGQIRYDSLTIDFPIEWRLNERNPAVLFFNGETPISSTSVRRNGDSVVAEFAQLATELRGVIRSNAFMGSYGPPARTNPTVIALPQLVKSDPSKAQKDISGVWIIPTTSLKGEGSWRFIVRQAAGQITATILRVDGDAGALIGQWQDSLYVLNHFDGTRPARLTVRPEADSSLSIALTTGPRNSVSLFTALRPEVARQRGVPEPTSFATNTRMRDPEEIFHFSFPDLTGQTVSDSDARFRGKVIIVTVGGSWCPNCHDEAPFLAALYRQYRAEGLEIVSLDFEDKSAMADLSRVKAFVSKYGIEYPVLIAGQTSEVHEKIPQAINLNTWPATFFVGRDGKVRAVRSGFAAPASGEFHEELKRDYAGLIDTLLREPVTQRP